MGFQGVSAQVEPGRYVEFLFVGAYADCCSEDVEGDEQILPARPAGFAMFDLVDDRDADDAGGALLQCLCGHAAERGLARVVDAAREVPQFLVPPARGEARLRLLGCPPWNDVVDGGGADDAERRIPGLSKLPVLLSGEVCDYRSPGVRGVLD